MGLLECFRALLITDVIITEFSRTQLPTFPELTADFPLPGFKLMTADLESGIQTHELRITANISWRAHLTEPSDVMNDCCVSWTVMSWNGMQSERMFDLPARSWPDVEAVERGCQLQVGHVVGTCN